MVAETDPRSIHMGEYRSFNRLRTEFAGCLEGRELTTRVQELTRIGFQEAPDSQEGLLQRTFFEREAQNTYIGMVSSQDFDLIIRAELSMPYDAWEVGPFVRQLLRQGNWRSMQFEHFVKHEEGIAYPMPKKTDRAYRAVYDRDRWLREQKCSVMLYGIRIEGLPFVSALFEDIEDRTGFEKLGINDFMDAITILRHSPPMFH